MESFEKQVRHALVDKGMSTAGLARELGISAPYLCDILKGRRTAEGQRARIAELLGIGEVRDGE